MQKNNIMTTTKKIFYVLFLLCSTFFYGQEIVTDRPDQTESSSTVGKNNFQLETGLTVEKYGNTESFSGPSNLIRYGIFENLELRLGLGYQYLKEKKLVNDLKYNGFNDLEFGAKVQIFKKEGVGTEIAFLSHLVLPTAKEQLSDNSVGVINKLAISHEITNNIGIGYNLGYDYIGKQNAFTYSVALGFSVSENVGFYVEPYGTWAEQNQFESNFDIGITYLLNPNFQLDAAYGFGLNSNLRYLGVGFSWKVPSILEK